MKTSIIYFSMALGLLGTQQASFAQDSSRKASAASVIEKNNQQAEHLEHKKIQQQQLQKKNLKC